MSEDTKHNQSDHDLLIRLDTKMDRSADDIKSLGHRVEEVRHDVGVLADGIEVKIAAAVSGKMDTSRVLEMKKEADELHKKQGEDIEQLKNSLEATDRKVDKYIFMAAGGLAVLQFLLQFGPSVWQAVSGA